MDNNERCVCCGEVVPEGRQVCVNCERLANSIVQGRKNGKTVRLRELFKKLREEAANKDETERR